MEIIKGELAQLLKAWDPDLIQFEEAPITQVKISIYYTINK